MSMLHTLLYPLSLKLIQFGIHLCIQVYLVPTFLIYFTHSQGNGDKEKELACFQSRQVIAKQLQSPDKISSAAVVHSKQAQTTVLKHEDKFVLQHEASLSHGVVTEEGVQSLGRGCS